MKKLISIITSAVVTLCMLSAFSSYMPAVCSADVSSVLTAGDMGAEGAFEGFSVELTDDRINFITDCEGGNIASKDKFELYGTEAGYSLKPESNGKYVIYFGVEAYEPAYHNNGSIWIPPYDFYIYEIDVRDNVVDISGMYKYNDATSQHGSSLNIFSSDGTSVTTKLSSERDNIFMRTVIYSFFPKEDYFFVYEFVNTTGFEICDLTLIITSNDPNALFYGNYDIINRKSNLYFQTQEISDILPVPEFIAEIMIPYEESEQKSTLKVIKHEGDDFTLYRIDHDRYKILPETLQVTDFNENDLNADGNFNVADVVQLQKYLLGYTDTDIISWEFADICKDGGLDVFDLVMLKKALVNLDAPHLTAGYMGAVSFDGIKVELDGSVLKFITDYKECSVMSSNSLCPCKAEEAYAFRPESNGKYSVLFIQEIPIPEPYNASIWFPPMILYSYEVEIKNNTVNINKIYRMGDWDSEYNKWSDEVYLEVFTANGTELYNPELGVLALIKVFTTYCMSDDDIAFEYILYNNSAESRIENVVISSSNPNAEIKCDYNLQVHDASSILKYAEDLPQAFQSLNMKKLFMLEAEYPILCHMGYQPHGTITITVKADKMLKKYSIYYADYVLLPSTLKRTEIIKTE